MSNRLPAAPGHLRSETRRWWRDIVSTWELQPHHLRLLTLAAEAWDRSREAREIVASEGLTVSTGGGGAKAHPAARIEADARLAFARLIREMGLDPAPPDEARPPALAGRYKGRS